ncbi:MAG: endopeptidase La [Sumerlaeia bacterium]
MSEPKKRTKKTSAAKDNGSSAPEEIVVEAPNGSAPTPDNPDGDGVEFPEQVVSLILDGPIVFPYMLAQFVLNDEDHKRVVDEALRGNRLFALFPSRMAEDGRDPATLPPDQRAFPVGTLCAVLRMMRVPDGTMRLFVHGVSRVTLNKFVSEKPNLIAEINRLPEIEHDGVEVEALMKQTVETLRQTGALAGWPEELLINAINTEEPGKLADLVAANTNMRPEGLREALAEADTMERLDLVFRHLTHELHVMEIGSSISDKVRADMDKNQRDFVLREQMKAIQRELGIEDPHGQEIAELHERLNAKAMPDHARAVAEKELSRLAALPPAAAEYGLIRTYLDTILEIPWMDATDDHIDLIDAHKILDEDHFGLEQVKERILEFLAVIRLKGGDLKGPILCLVGPPGVGKTSLGRSIARATGRNFYRFSLGGMRDEAEIRGHRRTYIGAMPGRIVKALRDCGSINPLIMLDEIDKLGNDYRGDPASALLEVLDPEQNDSFVDHYMDMPVDLSRTMFVTTANSLDTIPGPLRDRMEIIRLAGYTEHEKLEIAERYLVPREIEAAGLKKKDIRIHKTTLREIIANYTRESGVRSLQKQIGNVCRKVARKFAEAESEWEANLHREAEAASDTAGKGKRGKKKDEAANAAFVDVLNRKPPKRDSVKVDVKKLHELLGPPKADHERAERMSMPGVAIGLAYTPVGGEILYVEASRYPGKGDIRLTGQLGDVMKESATAALTYLRANAGRFSLEDKDFSAWDFHVHVPAGATPKDGPSAGVTMTTALASLVTGREVKDYLAMTGEITLRGSVLPVGGIKEKVLAAHNAGVKRVCLPKRNAHDLDELPENVRNGLDFCLVGHVDELLREALRAG